MNTRTLIILMMFAVTTSSFAAGVFRSVDENGKVTYSDVPPENVDSVEVAVSSKRTDNARITAAKQERAEEQANALDAAAKTAEEEAKKAEDDARIAENCRRASNALAALENAQRLYVPTEDGERRFLGEDEKQARIAKAQDDVEEWCNNPTR